MDPALTLEKVGAPARPSLTSTLVKSSHTPQPVWEGSSPYSATKLWQPRDPTIGDDDPVDLRSGCQGVCDCPELEEHG